MRIPSLVLWVFVAMIGAGMVKADSSPIGYVLIVGGLLMSLLSLARKPKGT